MRGQQYQYRGAIFVLLTILSGITSPFIVTNLETFAQTPSTQMQCSEVEIKNYIQKLSNSEPSIYNALVACKDKAIPELIKALKSQNQQIRIMVITALGEIGSPDAISPLSDLLSNERRWDIRVSVIFALSNFGKLGVPTLITTLKDKDWYIRYQAANALAEIGFDAKDAIPALNDAVKDENTNVRSAAKTALVEIEKQKLSGVHATGQTIRIESAIVNVPPYPSDAINNSGISLIESAGNVGSVESAIHPSPERRSSSIGKNNPRIRVKPRTVGTGLLTQSKPPLMCRFPTMRTIFKWKCG
jgi:hypothetical protein